MSKNNIKEIKELLSKPFPMLDKAKKRAKQLYKDYNIEEKEGRDCGNLFLEWVSEHFWGMVVKEHIPIFHTNWEMLNSKGHTKNNKFVFGDIDEAVWIEKTKDKNKKVIVCERYCSMANNNIHIFIMEKPFDNWVTFRVATVWHREIKSISGIKWGDDREIDKPSLNTYRKRDFHYGYYDCRDEGHCFKYEQRLKDVGTVEKAHWRESEMKYALSSLVYHKEALKDKYDIKGDKNE